jgi:hypothetical protein
MLPGLTGVGGFFGGFASSETVEPVTLRGTDSDRSSSANSLTFTLPGSSAAGDRAVIFASGAGVTTPSGWTQLTQADGINISGEIITKVLTSADISAGSQVVAFEGTQMCHLAGAVFVGDPNVRDSTGLRVLTANVTAVPIDGAVGDYVLWYAGIRDGSTSPSCTKGTVLETTVDNQYLELTGATLSSGDVSGGTVSASWTTTGDSYIGAVSLIPATYLSTDRVTDSSEQRVTDTGELRVIYERTA